MDRKRAARQALTALEEELFGLNEWMYRNPEVGFTEHEAARQLTAMLERADFVVERGVAGMETAFAARFSPGIAGPTIAIFAEYDSLPGIGHACGHNIIACSALGAAIAVAKSWPDLPGSLVVFGSPAEEQSSTVDDCGGKAYLVDAGLLAGVDAAMMMHPTNHDSAWSSNLAVQPLEMRFHGKTAQPAGSAHEGVNAFEAAVLAYNCINACRQYFRPDYFVHGMITESGPAPNIMSARSALRLHVRAPSNRELEPFLETIKKCGEAAAMVIGAQVEFSYYMQRYLEMVNNRVLATALEKNLRIIGRSPQPIGTRRRGSTDMGNVSQVVPTVHGYISLGPAEVVGNTHSPEFAPSTITAAGRRALTDAAASMALTAIDLLADPAMVERAKAEFAASLA
jgi:amidohydrolase